MKKVTLILLLALGAVGGTQAATNKAPRAGQGPRNEQLAQEEMPDWLGDNIGVYGEALVVGDVGWGKSAVNKTPVAYKASKNSGKTKALMHGMQIELS